MKVRTLRNIGSVEYGVQINISLREAKLFCERHKNITDCLVEDVAKAVLEANEWNANLKQQR